MQRKHSSSRFGLAAAHSQQSVGQRVRGAATGAAIHDPLGDPLEVFYQDNSKRDGDGPQLADGQRLDLLIRAEVATQDFWIEETVGMGHERPSHSEHPRISCQGTPREFG